MGPTCTCGAVLPPDARFCHKCGKPQYDDPRLEQEEIPQPVAPPIPETWGVPPPPPPVPGTISFRNLTAVRIGLVIGALTFAIMLAPMPVPLAILRVLLLPLGAGFASVWVYHRRTHQTLSIRGGAQMGWITGVFCFVFFTVVFTAVVLMLTQAETLEILRQNPQFRQQYDALQKSMQEAQSTMPTMIVGSLVFMFGILTFFPMVGGALGAKLLGKDS